MRSKFFLAAILVAGTASTAAAQLSVTPFAGTMVPLRSMLIDTVGGGTYFRMDAHTVYGLRISKQMSPSFGLQFQGGIGRGKLETLSTGAPLELNSSVWFADLRGRLRVVGNDESNLGLLVGAGWTQYSMGLFEAANFIDDATGLRGRVTGIVGVGVRSHLTGSASLTADLTDRIHSNPVEVDGFTPTSEPLQHDVAVTFGLNFPLGS